MSEDDKQQHTGQLPPGAYNAPQYQTYGQMPQGFAQQPTQPQPTVRSGGARSGTMIAAVTALALLVGGAAGGVGGYLTSESNAPQTVNALDEDPPAEQTGAAEKGSVEAVAQSVTPSVVQIKVQTGNGQGEGSGFVITDDGYIITNNHVVEQAGRGGVEVIFENGKRVKAEVVGTQAMTDVAVIKAEGVSGLDTVELGRSSDLRVGQDVVAIGSPFELSGTVTTGIVSAVNRPVTAEGGGQGTVMDAVQTDAAINPGNSGGPLVDMNGRVIGINSAIYSPGSGSGEQSSNVGIGFAIPIDQARRIADEIIKNGEARQTYIGASVQDGADGGARLRDIQDDSPAEKAGLKSGDVVRKIDDRVIADSAELVAAVRTRAPGEKVTLELADGRKVETTLGAEEGR